MASYFSYDSAEEDWDIRSLQFVNSQLEKYLNMVRIPSFNIWFSHDWIKWAGVKDAQVNWKFKILLNFNGYWFQYAGWRIWIWECQCYLGHFKIWNSYLIEFKW